MNYDNSKDQLPYNERCYAAVNALVTCYDQYNPANKDKLDRMGHVYINLHSYNLLKNTNDLITVLAGCGYHGGGRFYHDVANQWAEQTGKEILPSPNDDSHIASAGNELPNREQSEKLELPVDALAVVSGFRASQENKHIKGHLPPIQAKQWEKMITGQIHATSNPTHAENLNQVTASCFAAIAGEFDRLAGSPWHAVKSVKPKQNTYHFETLVCASLAKLFLSKLETPDMDVAIDILNTGFDHPGHKTDTENKVIEATVLIYQAFGGKTLFTYHDKNQKMSLPANEIKTHPLITAMCDKIWQPYDQHAKARNNTKKPELAL